MLRFFEDVICEEVEQGKRDMSCYGEYACVSKISGNYLEKSSGKRSSENSGTDGDWLYLQAGCGLSLTLPSFRAPAVLFPLFSLIKS